MSDTNVLRVAGLSGILFLILFIPSYLTAPDSPIATSSGQEMLDYFRSRQGEILTFNGIMLIFASFFFLWFLGGLYEMARRAEDGGFGFAPVVLGGGLLFIALMLAGAVAEIAHAATQARFQNFREDEQIGFLSLAMSGWFYRFAFVGIAAMIAATSAGGLRAKLVPAWLAWVGFAVAIVALLRYFGPLGGWLFMSWMLAVSILMIIGALGRPLPAAAREVTPTGG
ncbi:MAG: hypothetical protein GEU95_10660 [Rhizobiales bacterium]|nr:hypothetical protein [Hyphomicrobiales bacterium]